MEDPAHPGYPQELLNQVGPRNMVHSWATNTDDPTEMRRWGKIGKQKIEDAGTLYPKRMETVDDEILNFTLKFMNKAKTDNKPFFVWLNPTRMHVVTHLSPKFEAMRNSKNGWTIHEAGMVQLDDIVGSVMQKLKDMGVDDNTIVMFTTDNGTENFTWPDGAAVRIDDFKYQFISQPGGWTGPKEHPDTPTIVNLRLDPFERTAWPGDGTMKGSLEYFDWFQYEFWRFVFVQQQVGKLAMTATEYPHAEGRKLQPRCCKRKNRGSHEGPTTVVGVSTWRAARKGRLFWPSCIRALNS
jgi:arylsulfatase A-like enzyme